MHIGERQVHSLRAGRWNDMCRVAGKEEASPLEGFDDKASHACDALLQNSSFCWEPAIGASETRLKFIPNAVVAPICKIFIRFALQIQPGYARRSHAVESESTLVIHVDQLFA